MNTEQAVGDTSSSTSLSGGQETGASEETQKSSHKPVFIFLGIIAFFGVGLGGVLLGKYLFAPKTPQVTLIVTPTPRAEASTVTPSQDTTVDWKIYTNEKSQFSLRIPPDARTTNRDPDPFPVAIEINNLTPRTGGGGGPEMVGWLMIISEPQANNERLSLLAWADKYQLTSTDDGNKPQITTFTVGNKQAISWIGSPFQFRNILIQKSSTEVVFVLINPGELSATDPFFDQILSTFRFIDTDVSLWPADAETPAAGVCANPVDGVLVSVTINADTPLPRCAKVSPHQKLRLVNNTDKIITVSIARFSATIEPGKSYSFDETFGSFLAPGVHSVSSFPYGGPEIWLVD